MPAVGEIFESRYQITSLLGEGGFAIVFGADDLQSGEKVALKILKPDPNRGYDPSTRARFVREVQLLSQLRSPHTVQLFGSGTSHHGELYLVFERIPGRDLSEYLAEATRLPPRLVSTILHQLLTALAEAHALGLIHRDLKPENVRVFETADQLLTVKLLDFGIARPTDDSHPSVTRTGELIGTPHYMSPEQLLELPLTAASDIYSLGVMTLELLVGRDRLSTNRLGDQFDRLADGYVFPVPEVGPLTGLIATMTTRKPEQRFPHAGAALDALERSSSETPSTEHTESAHETAIWHPGDRDRDRDRDSSRVLVLALVVVTLGVIIAALVMSSPDDDQTVEVVQLPPALSEFQSSAGEDVPDLGTRMDAALTSASIAHGSQGCGKPMRRRDECEDGICVYLPSGYEQNEPHALLMVLHPQDVPSRDFLERFEDLAEREQIVVAAPQGAAEKSWRNQDGNTVHHYMGWVREDLCVDERRIFAFGSQDGGRAVSALDCWSGLAAVAHHAYLYQSHGDSIFKCGIKGNEKPVIWFAPRESKLWPWGGGGHCGAPEDNTVSVPATATAWAERNHCVARTLASDGCVSFDCPDFPTQFCTVPGGVAPWGVPLACGDETPEQDFDEVIEQAWAFFESNPLPKD